MFVKLTVTLGEAGEAGGARVTVLPGVVRFAETSPGQILTGTVCKLHITVTGCGRDERLGGWD